MANYYGNTRTNYFRVIDEDKFNEIMADVVISEDQLEIWHEERNGEKYFAFGGYGCLYYEKELEDGSVLDDIDSFYEQLQTVIHPEDAIILTEVGNEKLRYLIAVSVVITKDMVDFIDLNSESVLLARQLLKNNYYTTKLNY